MFAFDEDEKKHNKTKLQLVAEFLFIVIIFIDVNYGFVALCLSSIQAYSYGILSSFLIGVNFILIAFYIAVFRGKNKQEKSILT